MRFEIRHSDRREEVVCDSDPVVFGRDPSCDVVVRNPRCSRRHASVRLVSEGYQLVDMGSSNGVYVMGQKIEDAIIREGDVFSMGDVFVRLLSADIEGTLAMPGVKTRALKRPPEPARPSAAPPHERARPRGRVSLLAPSALGASSVAVGLALVVSPFVLGPNAPSAAFALTGLGALSALGGLGFLGGKLWGRGIQYLTFSIWILTCLLAPFGVVGIAYQLRGDEYPDSDAFFAVVIGVAGAVAMIALIAASLLGRIYVPAPLPL